MIRNRIRILLLSIIFGLAAAASALTALASSPNGDDCATSANGLPNRPFIWASESGIVITDTVEPVVNGEVITQHHSSGRGYFVPATDGMVFTATSQVTPLCGESGYVTVQFEEVFPGEVWDDGQVKVTPSQWDVTLVKYLHSPHTESARSDMYAIWGWAYEVHHDHITSGLELWGPQEWNSGTWQEYTVFKWVSKIPVYDNFLFLPLILR